MKEVKRHSVILTIINGSDMTLKRRKAVAKWLRKEARDLVKIGDYYSKRTTCRI